VSGRIGGALALDGINDFVNLGNSPLFDMNNKSFTISLWGSGAVANGTFVVAKGRGAWQGWDLSGGQATVGDGDSAVQGFVLGPDATGSQFFSAGTWRHAAVTVDAVNRRMTLYRNGIRDREVPITAAVSSQAGTVNLADVNVAAANLLVGTRGDGTIGPWFGGRVDDLRLYDRALSGAEIAQLAQVPSAYGAAGASMWIDASDLDANGSTAGEPAVGSSVQRASDRSGNGQDFVSDPVEVSRRPVLANSWPFRLPVLRFSTTQWMQNLARFDQGGPVTVVYLAAPRSSNSTMTRALQGVGNNWLLGWNDNSADRAFFDGWVSTGSAAKPPVPTLYSAVIRGTGQASSFYRDGALLASNVGGVSGPWGLSINKGLYSNDAGAANAEIDVAEVLVFPRALSEAERQAVENGLLDKWLASRNASTTTAAYGVANPGLWVDASDLDGNFSTANEPGFGSTVGTWVDRSGYRRDFTSGTSGAQPVRTDVAGFELPVLRFSTAQWMRHDATRFDGPTTIFYVAAPQSPTGTQRILQGVRNNWLLGWWNGFMDRAWFDGNWVVAGSAPPVAAPQLYSAVIRGPGQNSSVYRNGNLLAANTNATAGPDGLAIGNAGAVQESTAADVAEILAFPRVLSDAERQAVEQALLAKWVPSTPVAAGLVLAADANALSTMTTDSGGATAVASSGQSVCRWADRSGSGAHLTQPTTAQCPTYGTDATGGFVNFTANGFLDTTVALSPDASVFVVAQSNTATFNTYGWVASARGPNGFLLHPEGAQAWNAYYVLNSAGSWTGIGGHPVAPQSPTIYELSMAGSGGTVTGVSGVNGAVVSYSQPIARSAGNVPVTIGADQADKAGRRGNGRYREILVYDRSLTAAQRQAVEGYLAWKWGLTSSLPTDHPYRSIRPPDRVE
jgi:hypothetical protein